MANGLSRVAAIYDMHGNLPALEAVLREIRDENVQHIVVGGDVVPGPMTRETPVLQKNRPSLHTPPVCIPRCARYNTRLD